MIEFTNVTPEKIGKLLWQVVFMIAFLRVVWVLSGLLFQMVVT